MPNGKFEHREGNPSEVEPAFEVEGEVPVDLQEYSRSVQHKSFPVREGLLGTVAYFLLLDDALNEQFHQCGLAEGLFVDLSD